MCMIKGTIGSIRFHEARIYTYVLARTVERRPMANQFALSPTWIELLMDYSRGPGDAHSYCGHDAEVLINWS